jgi:DNA-binding beta-propeller fold protein YncE
MHMRIPSLALIFACSAWAQTADAPVQYTPVQYRHLYTFGSKDGIHPPKVLNRRAARIALGDSEHPYGLGFPEAVTTDARRRVWIADSGTASVHIFDPASGAYAEVRRVGGVTLMRPAGLTTDRRGRIYLTDAALGSVFVFDAAGEFERTLVSAKHGRMLEGPTAIAVSEDARTVYVSDPPRNTVLALNQEGESTGRIGPPGAFAHPAALALIGQDVLVLDTGTHRIRIFSASGKERRELTSEDIRFPFAVAYDAAHERFLVGDSRWFVVQVLTAESKSVGAFGQLGDGVDQVRSMDGLYVDPSGLVYLIDAHHSKVLVFAETSGAAP